MCNLTFLSSQMQLRCLNAEIAFPVCVCASRTLLLVLVTIGSMVCPLTTIFWEPVFLPTAMHLVFSMLMFTLTHF